MLLSSHKRHGGSTWRLCLAAACCVLLPATALSQMLATPDQVIVVSVGTRKRAELQEAQKQTFAKHLETWFYDEGVAPCIYVPPTAVDLPRFQSCDQRTKPDTRHGFGWWCATRRVHHAMAAALQRLNHSAASQPEWMLVLDDDTMLEPITLLELIGAHNSSEPLYIGNILNNFAMGGAGFLLSKSLLQALSAPWSNDLLRFTFDKKGDPNEPEGLPMHKHSHNMMDWCIERMEGGDWTLMHSDWALASCFLKTAGIGPTEAIINGQMVMNQWMKDCPVGKSSEGEVAAPVVSCHGYRNPKDLHAFYNSQTVSALPR